MLASNAELTRKFLTPASFRRRTFAICASRSAPERPCSLGQRPDGGVGPLILLWRSCSRTFRTRNMGRKCLRRALASSPACSFTQSRAISSIGTSESRARNSTIRFRCAGLSFAISTGLSGSRFRSLRGYCSSPARGGAPAHLAPGNRPDPRPVAHRGAVDLCRLPLGAQSGARSGS